MGRGLCGRREGGCELGNFGLRGRGGELVGCCRGFKLMKACVVKMLRMLIRRKR